MGIVLNLDTGQLICGTGAHLVVTNHILKQGCHLCHFDQTLVRILNIGSLQSRSIMEFYIRKQLKAVGHVVIGDGRHSCQKSWLQSILSGGQQRLRNVVGNFHYNAVGILLRIQCYLRIYCCNAYNLVTTFRGCCFGALACCCRSFCCGSACGIVRTTACSEGRCKHTAQDNSCQCLFHVCFLLSSFSLYASFVIPNSMMSFRFPSRNRCPDTVTKKGRIPRPIFLR